MDRPETTRTRARRLIADLRRAPPEKIHETAQRIQMVSGSLDLHLAGQLTCAEMNLILTRAERWLIRIYQDKYSLDFETARRMLVWHPDPTNDRGNCAW